MGLLRAEIRREMFGEERGWQSCPYDRKTLLTANHQNLNQKCQPKQTDRFFQLKVGRAREEA